MKDCVPDTLVRQIDATGPIAHALVAGSEAALREVYRPEECFSVPPEALSATNLQFYAAFVGAAPAGCVCLLNQVDYAEVKRFYVDPAYRGRGIGNCLMDHLEMAARDLGLRMIRLETGPELVAATALYRARGYTDCPPFGDYPDIPSNNFMEKRLF